MNVKEMLALATAQGAQVGSPYEAMLPIAKDVEGVVTAVVNQQTKLPTGGFRFTMKDDSGELNVSIASASYVPNKTKYDLVVCRVTRDISINGGAPIAKTGDKRLRAM